MYSVKELLTNCHFDKLFKYTKKKYKFKKFTMKLVVAIYLDHIIQYCYFKEFKVQPIYSQLQPFSMHW